jgi:hypothetical protein
VRWLLNLKGLIVGLTAASFNSYAIAAEHSSINPFRKNYATVAVAINTPQGKSITLYRQGRPQLLLGYLHNLDQDWMLGLGTHFKEFTRKTTDITIPDRGPTLGLWTFYHEVLRVVRIFHPIYLLAGPKLLYLMPTKLVKVPPDRDKNEQVEIGGGLAVSLGALLSDNLWLALRFERWRGFNTTRLQGYEGAISLSVGL